MSNVAINIAAEFTGKKAFDKAGKSVDGLSKKVKTLSRFFATGLILQYSKQSIKAFAADEAAAQRLSTAVANLGYSFSQAKVADFISSLERQSGVLDDQLRPAFQSLITTTGSLTMSQKLLNDAIQISRGSGQDLATVANDLALAYAGNTKGLKKYYTGLTQAELKSKSFSEILGVLLKNSAGSAEAYLTTTAYKMDVLTVATENAKETIGAGLVDAFAKIGGGSTASDAAKTIDDIAKSVNALTSALAFAVTGLKKLYQGLDYLTTFGGILGAEGSLVKRFEDKPVTTRSKSPAGTYKRMQEQKKAELEAIKRNRELAALAKKQADAAALALKKKQDQAALDKYALMLAKGEDIFNMDAIQIQAALTNQTEQLAKVTNQSQLLAIANDSARLRIKQDIMVLEKAIQDGDVNAAKAAAERLNTDIKTFGALQNQALKLADINAILAKMMPKELIDIANLNIALEKIKQINAGLNGKDTGAGSWMDVPASAGVDTIVTAANNNAQFLLDLAKANEDIIKQISDSTAVANANKTIVELKLSGGDELTNTIAKNLMNQSLSSGNQAYINRRTGGFE